MLSRKKKIQILRAYLCLTNDSYGDKMREELFFYFFELNIDTSFLDALSTEEEIKIKVDLLVSKMILHEHQDGLKNIIESYL